MTKILLSISLTLLASLNIHAATASVQGTDNRIEYRKGQTTFDASYRDNASSVRALNRAIENAGESSIDFIRIVTYVTPTSSSSDDMALAEKRAIDTKWLIADKFPELQGRLIYETRRSNNEGDVSIVTLTLKSEVARQTFTLNKPVPAPDQNTPKRRKVRSIPVDITSTTGDMFKDVRTDNPDVLALEAHVDYKVNEYTFDPNYMSNRNVLRALDKAIAEVGINNIDSVLVVSYASPEGSVEHNLFLAEKRAIDSKWFILKEYPELTDRVSHLGAGESWDGLRQLVENDRRLSSSTRYQVLDIIDNNYVDIVTKKALLRKIPADPAVGNVYQYLLKEHFPSLRGSTLLSFYLKPQPKAVPQTIKEAEHKEQIVFAPVETSNNETSKQKEEVKEVVVVEPVAIEEPEVIVEMPKTKKTPKETGFALKTNLLFDILTLANLEVEVPIGNCISLAIEGENAWWEFQKNKYAIMNQSFSVEPRYWFKHWGNDDMKMTGFFLGAYYMFGPNADKKLNGGNFPLLRGQADFQIDKELGYQGDYIGYQIGYISAGLTAGFVIPLGKRNHWGNMEFSISAGWLQADYQHYQPAADYSYLVRDAYNKGQVNWFGPTKAKISLVVPINFATKRAAIYAAQHPNKASAKRTSKASAKRK